MISLSFDTDHLDEARMEEFLAGFPIPGSATFFCTHPYESIGEKHEIAPHVVLEGLDWTAPLDAAASLFPEATGFRSHGCLYSHGLALELSRRGYRYISAHDQFGERDIRPRREAWGLWHLLIYYMDTLDISFQRHWRGSDHRPFARELLEGAVTGDALYVFGFHPIHMLLNSTSADAYLERRQAFIEGAPIDGLRCEGYGVADYYRDLVERMRGEGIASATLDSVTALAAA